MTSFSMTLTHAPSLIPGN